MKTSVLFAAFMLICSAGAGLSQRADANTGKKKEKTMISGYFEGTEPFWEMEIKDNYFVLHCSNDLVKDTLFLSRKQTHTETFVFQGENIFGIVRQSENGCVLDITEEGAPSHEIYFSYKNVTYMGCGKLTVRTE